MAPSVAVNGRPLGTNMIPEGDVQGESEIEVTVSWGREPLEPVTRTQTGRTAV
jgi:hypothetical protein